MGDRYIDNQVSPRLALRALAHSFRFDGRSTRSEVVSFWFFSILANLLIHVSASSLDIAMPSAFSGILGLIWALVLGWPYVPLLVRRLHDQGRSGKLALLWGAVGVSSAILLMLPESANGHGTSLSFLSFHRWLAWTLVTTPLLLASIVARFAMLVLYLLPETPGDNRYGPDPRVVPADKTTILVAN